MRLIDADALLRELTAKPMVSGAAKAAAMDLVRAATTIGGWISVKDRLPDRNEQVIICYEWTGRFSGNKYREVVVDTIADLGSECFMIAWMPLPEPPKEVTGDE